MKIGIDLGSTYSAFSVYDPNEDRVKELLPGEGESPSIPSVVRIDKNGSITCGYTAKHSTIRPSDKLFEAFKMMLNEDDERILRKRGYTQPYNAQKITGLFLNSTLKGIMQRYSASHIDQVVVCVPEVWDSKEKTIDGRNIVRNIIMNDLSFPVGDVRIVTEPEAASAYFAFHYEKETNKNFNGHILLIDYGGGTLDLTLTEVSTEGNGRLEIGRRENGGAGDNHPDKIGAAGIAFMQTVILYALRESKVIPPNSEPNYLDRHYINAVRDLETHLKGSDGITKIEDNFGSLGSYSHFSEVLSEDFGEFCGLTYGECEFSVTYRHLYQAYHDVIEPVLRSELEKMNKKVQNHIGENPCSPKAGINENFKIALVGGFGTFYFVRKQVEELYNMDVNSENDPRIKSIAAANRELSISFGAALFAADRVTLQHVARYSIGLYLMKQDRKRAIRYAIKYRQIIEPNKLYFVEREEDQNAIDSRVVMGALHGQINEFVVGFTDDRKKGRLMLLREEMLSKLASLPQTNFWHVAFSMDDRDIVSFHAIPSDQFAGQSDVSPVEIRLDSYHRMFAFAETDEVTCQ